MLVFANTQMPIELKRKLRLMAVADDTSTSELVRRLIELEWQRRNAEKAAQP